MKIAEIPSRLVAALSFSGGWSEAHFEKETLELLKTLADAKIKTKKATYSHCSIILNSSRDFCEETNLESKSNKPLEIFNPKLFIVD